jgi:glycosyltransferase involved in cell wall biosynthesis
MSSEVTAVITTHARPASVYEALASVQAELHEDLEVVVVDDGGRFVAPPGTRVPIRVVHGSNLGVARARNLGLAAARGEFIIYLDDDDVAVGGFDPDAEHFDDWAAWLRIADREAAIWSIPDTVAEWRIHSLGLSGRVLHAGAMKGRLLSLFEHLQGGLSEPNARAVAAARRVVASGDIITYDDYAAAMAKADTYPYNPRRHGKPHVHDHQAGLGPEG